ncbi:DUF881 domain-containing protein [Bacillus sp. M6-12]|uniref:DUF881 domain-containing protein n=1 Tax=Bacillus sp. M6-12 TaxID=2054166 RepID=UPI0021559624|nr:DUF881 domain-containing protein [Bacillus sp. M6-12]
MKVKGNHVILSLVALVLGFMIAFSYNLTNKERAKPDYKDKSWDREFQLRNKLIKEEEKTRDLQAELIEKQGELTSIEKKLANEANVYFNLAEDAEKYRMFLGKIKVKGEGVEVTLSDGMTENNNDNINQYLVHERHVFKVINELYISGAAAVAVNGQRINQNSYIVCNGPVITVDGQQHPAPFVFTAIGDADVLESSLNLAGGVKDQLVNENIIFTIEKKDKVILEPVLGS